MQTLPSATREHILAEQTISRDLRRKAFLIIACAIVLISWFAFIPVGEDTLSTFANILLPLVPAWWCLVPGRAIGRLGRGFDHQPRARRWACNLMAIGILCYPLGSCIDYYYALRGIDPFPSAADFFYQATYPFMFVALLLVATRGTSSIARSRLLLDSALTVAALATFSWYFLLGPILHEPTESIFATALSASYPVFDLANLFCVLFVSGRIAGGHARRVVIPMTIGVLLNITADTWWGYRELSGVYEIGEVVDAGWPLAFLCMGLALRAHLLAPYLMTQPEQASANVQAQTTISLWRALLPYALLPAVIALVSYDYYRDVDPFYRYGIYAGSILLLVLLLVRQLLSIHENIGLNGQLQKTLTALHESNQSLAGVNAKMFAINRASMDGVMILNRDWQIEEFNTAAQQMFGLNEKVAVGRPLRELFQLAADENQLLARRTEVVGHRANGSLLPVELAVIPVELDGPDIYVVFVRDLTQQKEAEAIREDLHQRLLAASRQAGMAEVATGVLHNVGNVLNSVNVSATLVSQKLKQSEIVSLKRAAELISAHQDDLGTYLTSDKRGQQLPGFLIALTKTLAEEQTMLLGETKQLAQGLEHIKNIIQSQQAHAKDGTLSQEVSPSALVDTALKMHLGSLSHHEIELVKEIEPLPTLMLDQHKVMQILVNLISNAKQAVKQGQNLPRTMRISVRKVDEKVEFAVVDNGIGIEPSMLNRIFAHGFTTKTDGHGFGLHSAANLAHEMEGTLIARSEGIGTGATFVLTLPMVEAASHVPTASLANKEL